MNIRFIKITSFNLDIWQQASFPALFKWKYSTVRIRWATYTVYIINCNHQRSIGTLKPHVYRIDRARKVPVDEVPNKPNVTGLFRNLREIRQYATPPLLYCYVTANLLLKAFNIRLLCVLKMCRSYVVSWNG